MSYENIHCPCGGKKLTDTMLCPECETALADNFDRREMDNPRATFEHRRNAAIRVLAVSRRRNTKLPLAFKAA
jgi:hypothetical protein